MLQNIVIQKSVCVCLRFSDGVKKMQVSETDKNLDAELKRLKNELNQLKRAKRGMIKRDHIVNDMFIF